LIVSTISRRVGLLRRATIDRSNRDRRIAAPAPVRCRFVGQLVRNFEMPCYYVASNLPAEIPAQFRADETDIEDNAELKKVGFVRVFENLPI